MLRSTEPRIGLWRSWMITVANSHRQPATKTRYTTSQRPNPPPPPREAPRGSGSGTRFTRSRLPESRAPPSCDPSPIVIATFRRRPSGVAQPRRDPGDRGTTPRPRPPPVRGPESSHKVGRLSRNGAVFPHEGDRPIVDELDLHLGAEDPRRDLDPVRAQRRHERVHDRLGVLRPGRADEIGPPAAPDRAGERELRDHEDLAADLVEAAVHVSLLVLEHPQRREPRGRPL